MKQAKEESFCHQNWNIVDACKNVNKNLTSKKQMKKRVAGRGEVWKGASLRMQLQHHLSAPKKQMHNHQM